MNKYVPFYQVLYIYIYKVRGKIEHIAMYIYIYISFWGLILGKVLFGNYKLSIDWPNESIIKFLNIFSIPMQMEHSLNHKL